MHSACLKSAISRQSCVVKSAKMVVDKPMNQNACVTPSRGT
jgi:hypothetical protein